MRRGAACLALLCLPACGDQRAASGGSTLEGPLTWEAAPLAFHVQELPPDATSLTVMAEAPGGDMIGLAVRDPAGRWLVQPDEPEASPNRVVRGPGRALAQIPDATAALPLALRYEIAPVRFSGGTGPVTLAAWIKRATGARQELPLAVVPAAAIDDRALEVALGEVGRIWRAAGIEVREPTRLPVDAPRFATFARVQVDPALGSDSPMVGEALALGAGAPADALVLVVVGDLAVAGPGYPIWALSGGIPIPPINGTPRSGVVVSGVLLAQGPLFAGQVMAHELGHALGLFHTTEGDLVDGAAVTDQIDDTPACPASADAAPEDGSLDPAECDRFDASNLMFWSAVRGATHLTAGQGASARRSARAR